MPEFWINMGPQHPMTHGLWNMKVKVDGETVTDAKPEIGYLHRGYEKIMEVREFQKNVVLTDRLCYVSSITWSHAYCLAVEKMMGIETPERGQWIRVVALELQRIASHLMWLAAYGPDLGLLTGLLWAVRERELFLDLIQLMSGARMNQNYPRVGGVRNDLPDNFEAMCRRSIEHFLEKVDNEYQRVFQESKVFHMRTEGVGKISAADAINWGVTGPNLRACGVNVDLRRLDPYEVYEEIDFEPQVWHDGGAGDSYARFVCRFNELRESCQIILQALEKMPKTGPYRVKAPRRAEGEGYAKTEDSRGEALFYVIGDGDDRPYRVKIRSPVFCTMAATPIMLRGNKLADSVTIIVIWATLINLLTMMWVERKFYSRLQDRYGIMISIWSLPFWPFNRAHRPTHRGTGYLQNIADGVKLLQKENLTPRNADSAMFHISPVLIASSTLMIFAALPWSSGFYVANLDLGILFIFAAFSLAPLGILIAGWSANNKYTLVGGLRAAAMLMAYEIPMILSVIALVFFTGSLNPLTIVKQQERTLFSLGPLAIPAWYVFSPQILGFIVFSVSMMAEMERIPFDIPEAEAELVEGWTTEYSGMRFGLVFGFKWLRMIAGAALIAILYLGGWSGPVFTTLSVGGIPVPIVPEEVWFLLKIYLISVVFIWISWSVPRVRIDQILNIGWKKLIPYSLGAIIIAAAAIASGLWSVG